MKAIELSAPDLRAFRQIDMPEPQARRGEVLLRLHAAALNYVDVAVASGAFPASFPMVPVCDGAGEIVALGEDVSGWQTGQRVVPHFLPDWQGGAATPQRIAAMRGITRPGSLSEYIVAPAHSLVALPAHLDYVQGATLPIAATTAWNGVRSAQLRPGSTVLILGTGGVSIFALQFAKASGAHVIITSSSDQKLERARQLGADQVINYRNTPEWDQQVLQLTAGRGVDLVLETVGGPGFARSLNAAAVGGTVFTVGFVAGMPEAVDLSPVIFKTLRIVGNNTGSVEDLAAAVRALEAHRIVPVVERVFDILETRAAYQELASGGRHIGKIAIAH